MISLKINEDKSEFVDGKDNKSQDKKQNRI